MPYYDSCDELDFRIEDLGPLPDFDMLWMADPRDYQISYAINPHMRGPEGNLHLVDRERARSQWLALRRVFEARGLQVEVIPPLDGHPDLVFCANPGLPLPAAASGAGNLWLPSRMASPQRQGEVDHLASFASSRGWTVAPLDGPARCLEGTGDGLWHPRRQLLWGGVGPRTDGAAWEELSRRYGLRVVRLELVDPDFYHLDTCLALLDEKTCLWYPGAFSEDGRELIRRLVAKRIEVDEVEARKGFACNVFASHAFAGEALASDGPAPPAEQRVVVIEEGCARVGEALRQANWRVQEVQTSEFKKSGGSVFCMKLALPHD